MTPLALTLALVLAEAPAPAPTAATPTPPRREVRVERRADGGFQAFLDGQPVAGADFYRAVLRLDLAERVERAQGHRTALYVAAGAAVVAGAGLGLLVAVGTNPTPQDCGLLPGDRTGCEVRRQAVVEANRRATAKAVFAGALGGAAAGAGLAWLGSRVGIPALTADEAEGLARAYRERGGPSGQPPGPGASLRLELVPGGALVALRLPLDPGR